MKRTTFRKREPIVYGSYGSVIDVKEDDSGRSLASVSISEYNKLHELPPDNFTLTEQLQAGVPLKEIDCSNLVGSTDSNDHPVDAGKLNDYVKKLSEYDKNE